MGVLLDTFIIIDILRQDKAALAWFQTLRQVPYLSVVTVTELYAGTRNKRERAQVAGILQNSRIIEINYTIAEQAGHWLQQFYKSHGIDLANALIAASATHHGLMPITRNIKHFPIIEGIQKPY